MTWSICDEGEGKPSRPNLGTAGFRAHGDTIPYVNGGGAAMSSSPWEGLWNGDEDVATRPDRSMRGP